jgi:predicted DsbA family dithiol-disulfide isomerase
MTDIDPGVPGRLRIIAYSDYVCPWCYIGLQRIEQLQAEFPVDVEWRPFELHPETPTSGADLRGRLGSSERVRAYTQNIIGLASESGLEMRMPVVVANSHRALEAAEFAREHGGFAAYHRALFHAYFEDARDVGDIDVLCEVARECSVDDQGLRQSLTDERYRGVIDEITNTARSDEILSTPTFVFEGGFRLTGAQDYLVFKSVTTRLLARRAASAAGE